MRRRMAARSWSMAHHVMFACALLLTRGSTTVAPAPVAPTPVAPPQHPHHHSLLGECMGGFLGGVAKQALTHPLETYATLREVSSSTIGTTPTPPALARPRPRPEGRISNPTLPTSRPRDGFKYDPSRLSMGLGELVRSPGRLYSGILPAVAFNLPYAFIFHSSMHACKGWLLLLHHGSPPPASATLHSTGGGTPAEPPNNIAVDVVSGSVAALAASVVGVPLECIKHRMQIGASLREAVEAGHLMSGLSSTIARNVPYNAVQFACFNACRGLLGMGASAAGFCAGVATAVLTTPLDVVNSRLQTQTLMYGSTKGAHQLQARRLYRGTLDAAATMFRTEGPEVFFRGIVPRVAAYAPSALVFFHVYTAVIAWVDGAIGGVVGGST